MAFQDYTDAEVLGNVSGLDESQSSSWDPASNTIDTGDLRRKYNFADKFTELSIAQTPFFRVVAAVGKKPTDDPTFKYTEKRQSWMKRYGYVLAHSTSSTVNNIGETGSDATFNYAADAAVWLWMGADYKSAGNIGNVIKDSGAITIGDVGTSPQHYLSNQIIKVNTSATDGGGTDVGDYALVQIKDVTDSVVSGYACHTTDGAIGTQLDFVAGAIPAGADEAKWYACTQLICQVVRADADGELCNYSGDDPLVDASMKEDNSKTIANDLEPRRSYNVGNAAKEGSQLMDETWLDNPYSTGYGYTQIFRSEFGMTNTMRATALKYEPNEWARVWKDKLIEHKWDIEQTALFGAQGKTTINGEVFYKTQGACDYILNQGNLFDLTLATKTQDDFLEDLSQFLDPRYNNANSTLFFCDTSTFNWLHKLSGYFRNNLEMSPNFNSDFASRGSKNVFGVDFTVITTVYGDMKVARNIHLDGSAIKMIGINMKYVKYRPLVGNGLNRDTTIYVGVQTLENTGTDKRVDMILTEAGFEWSMPEAHALWK